jgi:uncharacterized membrane protein
VTVVPGNGQLELTTGPGTAITSFTQADIDANRLVYVHNDSNTTSDSFTFTVSDGAGGSLGATVFSITVTAVDDDPPVVVANTGSTVLEAGTDPIPVTELEYTDTEQGPASVAYTVTTIPGNGQLELTTGPGTAITSFTQADIDAGLLVYVHNGSETTSDSFTFTVDDGQGNSVAGQVFNVTVTPQNDPPLLGTNSGITVNEGATGGIATVALEVTDVDNVPADLAYTVTVVPGNGQLELTTGPGTAITSFTQADIDANRLVYVHNGGETTSDTFTFTVSDGAGGSIGATAFNITVTPQNDDPVVNANTGITLAEGATSGIATADLEVTDVDNVAADLAYTVTVVPGNGQLELTTGPGTAITSFTQADIDANRLVYVHDGSNTTSDTFTFTVSDGAGGSLGATVFSITVTPIDNTPPAVVTNTGSTALEGGTDPIPVTELEYTDTEQGPASVAYTVTTIPGNGQLELTTGPGTAITSFTQADITSNRVVYVHNGGETTSDSFTFTVDDGQGNSVAGQVFNLTVTPQNDPPLLGTNAGMTVNEGATGGIATVALEVTDVDNVAADLAYTVTVVPGNGQLELTTGPGTAITSFTQADIDANRLVYAHNGGETTSDSFTFTVSDGAGGSIGATVFNITVTPQNDDPVVNANAGLTLNEGATGGIATAALEVTDVDNVAADLAYTVTVVPGNGQLELTTGPGTAITSFTQADIDANRLVYAHNGGETTSDSFTFTVSDGAGGSLGATVFNITVTPQNDDPVVNANTGITLAEGATGGIATAALEVTDVDNVAADLAYTVTVVPGNGQLELTTGPGTAITSFTQADIDAGRLVYVHNDSNTTTDSFTFTVSDGAGGSLGATLFSITVTAVDDDPPVVAANTGSTVLEAGTDPIPVTELEYTDTEQGPASVAYTVTTIPGNGQLELTTGPGTAITSFTQADIDAGLLVYVHNGGETISDSFTFTVDDGQGNSVAGQVFNLTVTPQNDPPVLGTNAGITVNEGATGGIATVALEVTDVDNVAADLAYTVTVVPGNGQLELTTGPGTAITSFTQADIDANRLVYVHNGGETTSDSFTFTVADGAGGSIGATVFNLTVTPQNDDPVVNANTGITLAEGATGGIATAALEVTDVDNIPSEIAYTVISIPLDGQLELTTGPGTGITNFTQADIDAGRLVYVHDGTNTTSDSFLFTVSDGAGGSIGMTAFNITINPVDDDPPVVAANTGSTVLEGGTDPIPVTELEYTDTEQAPASVAYTVTTIPGNGQLELTTGPGTAITSFTQADITANRLVYVHNGGETTSDSFTFTVDDGQGNSVAGQVFNVTVTPQNDPPLLGTNAGITVNEGATGGIATAALEVTDVDNVAADLAYTVTVVPGNGQLELTTGPGTAITSFTQADIDANRLVYRPQRFKHHQRQLHLHGE